MNPYSFLRKVIYLVMIAVLLVPLSLLSQPATVAVQGRKASPGGKLAQERNRHKLGQVNLGKIDPTSETLKLATLGFRGVAATVLWNKAAEYKKKKDWTNLSATVEQIANLQPNYINVWHYQAWEVSYNISAEWDDYRDRYFWVMKGLRFLQEGTQYNENEPALLHDIGRFSAYKIGRSDERKQFRRLFFADDDFHNSQWVKQRDSWLFGKEYFREGQRVVDNLGVPLRSDGPLIFHSRAPLAQMYYADALEAEGTFGQRAKSAWSLAGDEWREFALRDFPSGDGETIRLGDLELLQTRLQQLREQLEALNPGSREQLQAEKLAALPPNERAALKTAPDARTGEESRLAAAAQIKVGVTDLDLAERAPEKNRAEARRLAEQATKLAYDVAEVVRDLEIVNFPYWQLRCEMETSDDALAARRLLYEARQALRTEADPWTARDKFQEGFALWRRVVDRYPMMLEDQTAFEIVEFVDDYTFALDQLDEKFPQEFILQDVVDAVARSG